MNTNFMKFNQYSPEYSSDYSDMYDLNTIIWESNPEISRDVELDDLLECPTYEEAEC